MPSSILSAEVSEPRVVPTLICSIILQAPGPPVALADPFPTPLSHILIMAAGWGPFTCHLGSGCVILSTHCFTTSPPRFYKCPLFLSLYSDPLPNAMTFHTSVSRKW